MATYRALFTSTISGYADIEAKTPQEADKKAFEIRQYQITSTKHQQLWWDYQFIIGEIEKVDNA